MGLKKSLKTLFSSCPFNELHHADSRSKYVSWTRFSAYTKSTGGGAELTTSIRWLSLTRALLLGHVLEHARPCNRLLELGMCFCDPLSQHYHPS